MYTSPIDPSIANDYAERGRALLAAGKDAAALEALLAAIEGAGYRPGEDVYLAIDAPSGATLVRLEPVSEG